MRSSFVFLIVAIVTVHLSNASIPHYRSSGTFPAFLSEIETCVENKDYPQIIELLKKCRNGEINLQPQELLQCVSTVIQPEISKFGNDNEIGNNIRTFLNSSVGSAGEILNGALTLNIGDLLNGELNGVVAAIDGGLDGFLNGVIGGLESGNIVRGLLLGLTGSLAKGATAGKNAFTLGFNGLI